MNRRQRKKQRLGEFQELGFSLAFALPERWTEDQQLAFWDRAIEQIESLGLMIGGGVGPSWDVVVAASEHRHSVTAAQRQALVDFLAADPDVAELRAGALVDVWHGGSESVLQSS
jgi:uncharacterized protein